MSWPSHGYPSSSPTPRREARRSDGDRRPAEDSRRCSRGELWAWHSGDWGACCCDTPPPAASNSSLGGTRSVHSRSKRGNRREDMAIGTIRTDPKGMPGKVRENLRHALPTLEAAADGFVGSPEAFQGAKLRMAARIGGYPRERLTAELLELSSASTAAARIQAARTLPLAQRRIGFDFAATLALTLARDSHHDVRAAGARALPQLAARRGDSAIALLKHERLLELLNDPGTVVPFGVLAGFLDATRAGLMIGQEFATEIKRIRHHHNSHVVRSLAQQTLDALGGETPSEPGTESPKPLPSAAAG